MLRTAAAAFVALTAAAVLPTPATGFAPLSVVTVCYRHHFGASSWNAPANQIAGACFATRVPRDNTAGAFTERRLSTTWEKRWWVRFDELKAYKDLHGDCNVPGGWSRNPPLANWVNNQRQAYQRLMSDDPEKKSSMTEKRIIALEGIGFEWVLGTQHTEWEIRFEELLQYKKEHENCNVPQTWGENPQLGYWVRVQREQYKLYQEGKPSFITEERIAALDGIGFVWDRFETVWESRFAELLQYKQQHENCNVPSTWSKNPQLAKWVSNQRRQYKLYQEGKRSSMTEERIAALDGIGFEWVLVTQTDWGTRFDELLQYKKELGDCNVPSTWSESPELGRWVSAQRKQYILHQKGKPSQITEERIAALEDIGFEWVLLTLTEWETRFDELLQYKKEHGNCNVPLSRNENSQLARWVSDQRTQYRYCQEGKRSSMTRERVDLLEGIGFQWKLKRGRKEG